MGGGFVRAPCSLIDIEFEDKERQRIYRRAVGKEKLYARLRHRRRRHDSQDFSDGVRRAFLGIEPDRDDEPIVQSGKGFGRYPMLFGASVDLQD
jgi:hypothetical protein